jgi:hypothetical protein
MKTGKSPTATKPQQTPEAPTWTVSVQAAEIDFMLDRDAVFVAGSGNDCSGCGISPITRLRVKTNRSGSKS